MRHDEGCFTMSLFGLKREKLDLPRGDFAARAQAIVRILLGVRIADIASMEVLRDVQVGKFTYDAEVKMRGNDREASIYLQRELIDDYEFLNEDKRKVLRDRVEGAYRALYPEWSPLTPFGKPY